MLHYRIHHTQPQAPVMKMMDDYDGQLIFGDLVGLKLPDIRLTGEEKPRKNLTQETCPDRGSNPGPLRDKRACYHLFHSGGLFFKTSVRLVVTGSRTRGLPNASPGQHRDLNLELPEYESSVMNFDRQYVL